jgi:hypothetical protein
VDIERPNREAAVNLISGIFDCFQEVQLANSKRTDIVGISNFNCNTPL